MEGSESERFRSDNPGCADAPTKGRQRAAVRRGGDPAGIGKNEASRLKLRRSGGTERKEMKDRKKVQRRRNSELANFTIKAE